MFGLMQILTGIVYGLPMPMQPLKAMAVLVITKAIPSSVLFGAGCAIGLVMLILSLSGALNWLAVKIRRGVRARGSIRQGSYPWHRWLLRNMSRAWE